MPTPSLLDQFLPEWHFHERHQRRMTAEPGQVVAATAAVTWSEAGLAYLLSLLIRNPVVGGRPLIDTFGGLEGALARADDELVFGAISPMHGDGPAHKNLDAEAFRSFTEPGHSKVGFNFRYADGVLTTETRIALTDPGSHRLFRFYWSLIRPFSGLTRRSMLNAIGRRVNALPSRG